MFMCCVHEKMPFSFQGIIQLMILKNMKKEQNTSLSYTVDLS